MQKVRKIIRCRVCSCKDCIMIIKESECAGRAGQGRGRIHCKCYVHRRRHSSSCSSAAVLLIAARVAAGAEAGAQGVEQARASIIRKTHPRSGGYCGCPVARPAAAGAAWWRRGGAWRCPA